MNVLEARDLDVYKKLLKVLGEYSDKFPGTGVTRMFNQALSSGKKILPKDKLAIDILHFILKNNSTTGAIHRILNHRFSNLPVELQPLIKDGRSKRIAHWTREALVSDKIKDLIDWKGVGKKGFWSTVDGEKVKLYEPFRQANEQTEVKPKKKPVEIPTPVRRPKRRKSSIAPVPHQRPEPKGFVPSKDVELFKKKRIIHQTKEQTEVKPKEKPIEVPTPVRRPKRRKSPIVPIPHQRPEPKGSVSSKDVELFKKKRIK